MTEGEKPAAVNNAIDELAAVKDKKEEAKEKAAKGLA